MDNGYPLLTERFPLEQLFKKDNLIQKVETSIIAPLMNEKEKGDSLEKYIDSMSDIRQDRWSVNDHYCAEEVLFDVVEYLDCIIDK